MERVLKDYDASLHPCEHENNPRVWRCPRLFWCKIVVFAGRDRLNNAIAKTNRTYNMLGLQLKLMVADQRHSTKLTTDLHFAAHLTAAQKCPWKTVQSFHALKDLQWLPASKPPRG